ncbi:hypothetical protein B0H13DRAFT_2411307 [Mycena leptocephala]|nr:hypothetical protein B0H13DRAFT_2411307 [Mycena leptocephala]
MSSDDSELFGLRDIYLNITLVQAFGNGIYFVIFFLAFANDDPSLQEKTHKLLFIVVILMYIFATIQTCPRPVNYLTQPTFTLIVLPATLLVANTFLADCVLIYAVWNHDWRVIILPTMSTIGGTVLGILTVVETGNFHVPCYDAARDGAHRLRILWLTRDHAGTAFSGYRAIIEMVVESALLYSITLIVYILLLFGPDTSNNDGYAQAILIQMTASPTLIVARYPSD